MLPLLLRRSIEPEYGGMAGKSGEILRYCIFIN